LALPPAHSLPAALCLPCDFLLLRAERRFRVKAPRRALSTCGAGSPGAVSPGTRRKSRSMRVFANPTPDRGWRRGSGSGKAGIRMPHGRRTLPCGTNAPAVATCSQIAVKCGPRHGGECGKSKKPSQATSPQLAEPCKSPSQRWPIFPRLGLRETSDAVFSIRPEPAMASCCCARPPAQTAELQAALRGLLSPVPRVPNRRRKLEWPAPWPHAERRRKRRSRRVFRMSYRAPDRPPRAVSMQCRASESRRGGPFFRVAGRARAHDRRANVTRGGAGLILHPACRRGGTSEKNVPGARRSMI